MNINQRIQALQALMKKYQLDTYYITTKDDHNSEFVHPYFRCVEFLTGFTGSNAHVIVTENQCRFYTDGRYSIQAKKELQNTSIQIMEDDYMDFLKSRKHIGLDGKKVSKSFVDEIGCVTSIDLISKIWTNRPDYPLNPVFQLDEQYTGKSFEEKRKEVLSKCKSNIHLLTNLDDIAWLLNCRGSDAISNPVFLSYVLLYKDKTILYMDSRKIIDISYFKKHHIQIKNYLDIYQDLKYIQDPITVDENQVNYELLNSISNPVFQINPIELLKACKNKIEIENLRQCQIMDCVALTKFIYWLKTNVKTQSITEYDASIQLKKLRKELPGYIEVNYGSICAYNENGAMMHYQPTKEKHSILKPEGSFLVDSGGQYLNGTTDITRTFSLGKVSQAFKKDFTCVLKSHIQLAQAKFLYGTSGIQLDILAREPIWQMNLDYQCGTGHGLGFCLNVHEGPHGIRWYKTSNRKEDTILELGMYLTNEPGIYKENEYGIRIENDMVVQKGNKNQYGQFMYFETISYVPIDLDCIDPSYLDSTQIQWLNEYHEKTYTLLSPYLNKKEKNWLKEQTKKLA
ncbi:M24 family metallopeptidase [Floccifex sp.]|uniref:M24 family metallopeptidase n=1 Tax=Floccifex sp. TaxID=2815810 RepID=UPI003F022F07